MTSYTFEHPTDVTALPVPLALTLEEATEHANRFATSIFRDWTKLNAILKRFEDTIQKRWIKKSSKQRREVLLKAWPEIPQTHRPDFAAFRGNCQRVHFVSRAAFLWPYINLEDLLDRSNLLHFLHSRGRSLPEVFAVQDLENAHLGPGWDGAEKALGVHRLFHGRRSPRAYEDIISLGKPEDAYVKTSSLCPCCGEVHTEEFVTHPHYQVLLILEIQHAIYSSLLCCAQTILHDIDPRQYLLAPHRSVPAMPESSTGGWSALATHMRQAPYCIPAKMHLKQLKMLVDAQKSSAEDHVWMLREDPGYFISTLKEEFEHCEWARKPAEMGVDKWHVVIGETVYHATYELLVWHYISKLLRRMRSMQTQLSAVNPDTLRLHKCDEDLWVELLMVIACSIHVPQTKLAIGFPFSPRVRHYFSMQRGKDKKEKVIIRERRYFSLSEGECRVIDLVEMIRAKDYRERHGLSRIISEALYMLETDAEASQLMDSWILAQFSELALLSGLSDCITSLQPWCHGWKDGIKEESRWPEITETVTDFLEFQQNVRMSIVDAVEDGALAAFTNPQDPAWEYPILKKKTATSVAQMIKAESSLDALWDNLHVMGHDVGGICLDSIIVGRMAGKRKLQRTAPWVEPVTEAKKSKTLGVIDVNIPRFSSTGMVTSATKPTPTKQKIKTRGIANASEGEEHKHASCFEISHDEATSGPESQRIKVPKRAYKILSALFPASGADNHQRKEIEWTELCQALDAIGLQPEKLYGSVWLFKPKAKEQCLVEMERSIQFHEPKEVRHGSKIPAGMVRMLGRRLKHAFGWENGMFVSEG